MKILATIAIKKKGHNPDQASGGKVSRLTATHQRHALFTNPLRIKEHLDAVGAVRPLESEWRTVAELFRINMREMKQNQVDCRQRAQRIQLQNSGMRLPVPVHQELAWSCFDDIGRFRKVYGWVYNSTVLANVCRDLANNGRQPLILLGEQQTSYRWYG